MSRRAGVNAHACAKFPAHAHFLKDVTVSLLPGFSVKKRERAIYGYVYLHWVTIANHTTIAAIRMRVRRVQIRII